MQYSEGIAVVIPVKNTPPDVLRECLNSVFSQNYTNFDLICVDDGSDKADTVSVLEEFNNSHSNMAVIRQEKSCGAGPARNVGFSAVLREYTLFFDSDDIMLPDYIANLYSKMCEGKFDVCISGLSHFEIDSSGNRKIISTLENNNHDRESWDFLIRDALSPCDKLFSTAFLHNYDIQFPELKTDEDAYFSAIALLCAEGIGYTGDSENFLYRFNTSFQLSNDLNPFRMFEAMKQAKMDYRKKKCYKKKLESLLDNYLIVAGCFEMNRFRQFDEEISKEYYTFFRDYLITEDIKSDNGTISAFIEHWKNDDYSSEWFKRTGSWEFQLDCNRDSVINRLKNEKKVYLWGVGKRGKIIIHFAERNKFDFDGIYDRNVDELNKFAGDYNILKEEKFLLNDDALVIATNGAIFECISKEKNNCKVITIEQLISEK